jgi:hypothetical protein
MKKTPSPIQRAKKERAARNGELVEARETERGRGLFARVELAAGELLCGLRGDELVFAPEEMPRIVEAHPAMNDYCANGPGGKVLVPRDPDTVGWHVANHSCNPNAKLESATGEGLRARRAIRAGEEITCWYGWSRREVRCLCGEPNCTGWIGLPHREYEKGFRWTDADARALLISAASVANYEGIETVIRALRSADRSEAYVRKYILDVLGPTDGERVLRKTLGV